jgi:hypothetical protein
MKGKYPILHIKYHLLAPTNNKNNINTTQLNLKPALPGLIAFTPLAKLILTVLLRKMRVWILVWSMMVSYPELSNQPARCGILKAREIEIWITF